MKRGKEDDKIMGPMFPRLHVNDAEKGGPRAPPRNKMALYEQLSVPTQRFNPAVLPPTSNNTSLVPPASSSQGIGRERNLLLPLPVPSSTSAHLAENFPTHQPAGATLNTHLPLLEQRKKVGDEDDFAVPVCVQSGRDECHSKTQNGKQRGKKPSYPGNTIKLQNVCDKDAKRSSPSGLNLRQEARHQVEENPKTCISVRDHSDKSSANLSTRDRIDWLPKETSALPTQEYGDLPGSNFNRLNDSDASPQHELRAELEPNDRERGDCLESMRDVEKGVVSPTRSVIPSGEDNSSPNEPVTGGNYHGTKTCGLLQLRNGDKSDDISEISMLDYISGLDISPDDVVGIIGQKHFWKARKAIINQQRVFALQVFELHRLIKVQQLIAESPHLLVEDSAYLGKPSLNTSPVKKLLPEYVIKPLPHIIKCKDDSEKPNHKMECSAENAVGKTSLSSVKNGSQPSNYGPYHVNPPPAAVANDSRMGPWCFHQSPGHQWLFPIMSPSEGLIYKPYPGPGFMGTVCAGGCGPFGPYPLPDFMNPAYGMPSPLPHQGIGVIPGAHPVGHNYFPSYGMPSVNSSISASAAEQKSQFAGPGSHCQNGDLSEGGANFNMQHESSCNVPAEKSGAIPQVMQFQASKETELQGSTASSPGERVQGNGNGSAAEGRDALPLVTRSPMVPEGVPQPRETEQPTKVIKVVPHNPRSATESVARIFQSIQEERKQFDSI